MANVSSSNGLEKRPKLRFPDFDESYKDTTLGEIASLVNRTDPKSDAPIMMLSAGNGFIMQSEKYSRDNAGQSLKKYILLKKGELAYNHGASKAKQYGCCYELTENEARIPYVYHCFKVCETEYTPYIAIALNNTKMDNQLKRLVSSSVRMDGLLNISFEDYMSITMSLPSSEEQKHIADFLSKLDERIKAQERLVSSLKKYKRGAVSKLLNGTLAFNGFSDMESWQLKRVGDFCEVQMCKRVFKEQTTPDGDVPFYKIGTIGGLPDAYISRSLYEEYKMKYSFPRKGEFLISCAGTVGKCVPYNGEDSYYQDSNIVWLRNNSQDVSNEYLYLLISNVDWGTLNSTTITRIYNDNLRELSFHIPSLQMQKRIAEYIFALSKRIDSEQAMFEKLQQEKLGLLQQLFI